MYRIGIDLGGTNIVAGVVDDEFRIVATAKCKTRIPRPAEEIVVDMARMAKEAVQNAGLTMADIAYVGVGSPGTCNADTGIVEYSNNLQFEKLPLRDMLGGMLDKAVYIENDANAAALGEMSQGGGKGARNVVFVTLGTGVGGGVIVDGRLLAGVHGAGGEIGHIKVRPGDDRVCGCGKTGCLEQYASATGLVRSAKALLADPAVKTSLRSCADLTCTDVFDCAKAGDEAALRLVDEMADLLGQALAAVSCVCDPEVIVVGGGVARAGQMLLDRMAAAFRRYAFPAAEETRFALAALGNDAGIWGSVQMVRGA